MDAPSRKGAWFGRRARQVQPLGGCRCRIMDFLQEQARSFSLSGCTWRLHPSRANFGPMTSVAAQCDQDGHCVSG
eukprot:scaffold58481_cov31-Tisochrysis_lutea.AAC.1